jgi:hypothetical protein
MNKNKLLAMVIVAFFFAVDTFAQNSKANAVINQANAVLKTEKVSETANRVNPEATQGVSVKLSPQKSDLRVHQGDPMNMNAKSIENGPIREYSNGTEAGPEKNF